MDETTSVKYPDITVQLSGKDGNVYAIMGRVIRALKEAGVSSEEQSAYVDEAKSGDYDHLLQVTMRWVDIT